MHNIETLQAYTRHEPPSDSSSSISNPKIRMDINFRLATELNELIVSPVMGMQKVRKVLHRFGLDIPALYELNYEGDELVLEMDQFGKVTDSYFMPQFSSDTQDKLYYLYLVYYLTDIGNYEFYAELTDLEGINSILDESQELEDIAFDEEDKDNE